MTTKPLTVAVTGLNATDNPGPGVAVIRAVREGAGSDVTIIGLAYDPLDPGVYMTGVCDHVYLIPYPSQGKQALTARLNEIHAKTPIDVILPTLDSELQLYMRLEPILHRMGIATYLPTEEALNLTGKAKISKLARTHAIRTPKGVAINDSATLYRLRDRVSFPVMVKGRFYDAAIAHTPMEAETIFHRFSSEWGLPVLVQEYIAGDEYDVTAVGDGNGGVVGIVPMRKLRLTDKGKAWGGITVSDKRINRFACEIVSKTRWQGPCELEIIKSRDDGELYLIEVNPRFPAWCYLCAGAGRNLPWACVNLALGEKLEPCGPYAVGAMFIRHSIDMVYPLSMFESLTTTGELHG